MTVTAEPGTGAKGSAPDRSLPPAEQAPAWIAPAEVAPLTIADVRRVLASFSKAIGLRPAGWALLGAVVALIVGGVVLHWVELLVAAVAGFLILLVGFLFTIGKPQFGVTLTVPDRHVTVGTRTVGSLALTNEGVRRTLPSRVDLPVAADVVSMAIPSLASKAGHAEDFVIPTHQRAVIEIGPAKSVQGDPFGLLGRETLWTGVTEVFVHPATVRLPGRQTGFLHDLEGHPSGQMTNSDMNFHALRPYVPGDDRRHVHWRSSARTGQLMVRQYEETRQSRIAIGIDLADASYASDAEFETAVSTAASFVQQAFREENPVALVTNVEAHPGLTATRLLNELSRVERLARTHVTDVVRLVRDREPAASIVILVTGSRVRTDRVRRTATLLSVDSRVIAVRIAPNHALTVDTVSNVSVLQVPKLSDLPRAVRRAAV